MLMKMSFALLTLAALCVTSSASAEQCCEGVMRRGYNKLEFTKYDDKGACYPVPAPIAAARDAIAKFVTSGTTLPPWITAQSSANEQFTILYSVNGEPCQVKAPREKRDVARLPE